jgi:hypothetical protein
MMQISTATTGAFAARVKPDTLCANISRIDWRYVLAKTLIVVLGSLLAMLAAMPPASAQVPPGGYLQTCRDVRFDGFNLSAMCLGAGGQFYPSRLAGAGGCRGNIANLNGQLVCVAGGGAPRPQYGGGPSPQYGGPPAQYGYPPPRQEYGGPGYGRPYDRDGDYGGGGFPLPGGSWRLTCGNAVMRGPILFAECERGDGAMLRAQADTRACRRFANINGQLVCQ